MKIFLAGNDGSEYAVVLHALGYPYRLSSYFYMVHTRPSACVLTLACMEASPPGSEWILDSGLYSLMFGAEKGTLKTFDDYLGYAQKYVATVKEWGWKHAIVECDVQRVLGVPETHRIRDEVFRPSGLETIYVWHLPEGDQGLVELAKRERRVALSVPEFRAVIGKAGPVTTHTAILAGLRAIRRAGRADQRVHLLGNTERAYLQAPAPADTCDSTSWISGGRYGRGMFFDQRRKDVNVASVYSPKWRAWRSWCEATFPASFELVREFVGGKVERMFYYGNALCSAISYVLWMEALSGESVKLVIPDRLPPGARFVEDAA